MAPAKGAYASSAEFLNAFWGDEGEVAQRVSRVSDTGGGGVLCVGVQTALSLSCLCRVAAQQESWLGV